MLPCSFFLRVGVNLDAARIVDDVNWYMSEFGFFDQQKEAVVHFGIAPCVILQVRHYILNV